MKLKRVAITVLIFTFLMSTAVFAKPAMNKPDDNNIMQGQKDMTKVDPVKWLEAKKTEIQKKHAEGRITKEEADRAISRIDAMLVKIKEFNKLTPSEKKEKVISDFTSHIEKKVQEGRMTREEADKKIAKLKEQISKWDGNGYPPFAGKAHGAFGHEKGKHSEERMKEALGKAVKDGKITQKQADSIMEYFKK